MDNGLRIIESVFIVLVLIGGIIWTLTLKNLIQWLIELIERSRR